MSTRARTATQLPTRLVVLLLALLAAAAGVFVWSLGHGGSDGPLALEAPVGTQADPPSVASEVASDDPDESQLPEITYELLLTRDPFEPVRPEPEEDPSEPSDPSAPSDPSDPSRPVDPSDPSRPVDPSDPTRPVDPSDPCQPSGDVMVCEGTPVRTLEVLISRARIQVGDVIYEPTLSQVFANDFRLTDIQSGCAVITYDGRQTFRQCPDDDTFK